MHWSVRARQGLVLASALAMVLPFALAAELKPLAQWKGLDILSEGGIAVMAGGWAWLILGSRPHGRVTTLLAAGLAGIMLGAWTDCLDEFFRIDGWHWNSVLESGCTLLGMLTLTLGLLSWRQEQSALSEHLFLRERLFRDHRGFDRLTQLADADYLVRQVALERVRQPDAPCSLVLIDLDGMAGPARGPADEQRMLQAVSHQLLLNLRGDDLLCRYAGDRFVVLMPETALGAAHRHAEHLCRMLNTMTLHTRQSGARLVIAAHARCAEAGTDARATLDAMNRAVDHAPAPRCPPAPA